MSQRIDCPKCGGELEKLNYNTGTADNLWACNKCTYPDSRYTIEKAKVVRYKDSIQFRQVMETDYSEY